MAVLRVTLQKKTIHKFFGTVVKKIMNTLHASIFSFIILKFSQKGILDFHVTTTTVDVCIKEVMDTLKEKS